jgi:hypothetical protein
MIKSLDDVITGLQRLEVTYSADVATVSTIQVLRDRIEKEIKSIEI